MISMGQIHAKSFGVIGEVFPVAEKSFLKIIEERLTALNDSGALEAMNQRWIQTAAEHANRPSALNLPRTNHSITHHYVPEITLSQDIRDERGRVLYVRGTHVNALSQLPSYQPCWLFFNADDEAQMNWAQLQKTSCSNPKLILTGGAINADRKKAALSHLFRPGWKNYETASYRSRSGNRYSQRQSSCHCRARNQGEWRCPLESFYSQFSSFFLIRDGASNVPDISSIPFVMCVGDAYFLCR